ncbi:MAG: hypothetical protein HZA88_09530 [Verrucomicrobia bacterium]|nr:hypothetical protein [Verrucomicrobiota bacterium]
MRWFKEVFRNREERQTFKTMAQILNEQRTVQTPTVNTPTERKRFHQGPSVSATPSTNDAIQPPALHDSTNQSPASSDAETRQLTPTQATASATVTTMDVASSKAEMNSDRLFTLRIALFNACGFMLVTGGITYVDSHLHSHVISAYRERHYALGMWIMAFALPLFILTYIGMNKARARVMKSVISTAVIMGCGAVALWNCRPEFPHPMVLFWITLYAICGTVSVYVRYAPSESERANAQHIPLEFRLEWLKERIAFWRTMAVSFVVGYMALMIPWVNMMGDIANAAVREADDIILLRKFIWMCLSFYSIYVLVAVICELIRRAKLAGNVLLELTK